MRGFLLLSLFLVYIAHFAVGQSDSGATYRQWGILVHSGLARPVAEDPGSRNKPTGLELTYSLANMQRRSWEHCGCFFRVGAYANYLSFGNPALLGRTAGAGLFFEPIIAHRPAVSLSVRTTAGLTYLTRVYHPETNPRNIYFSMPLSALIGASLNGRIRLSDHTQLLVTGTYYHISNAGTRQPNQGLNVPALSVGVEYQPKPFRYPDSRYWHTRMSARKWMLRATLLASVRVLPETTRYPEMALPMYGVNLVGGYRFAGSHVISAGIEGVDDLYFKEQLKRWHYKDQRYRQGTVLAGYEFWHGHYVFAAHMGWNVIRPMPYKPASYQKYSLLYRFDNGITAGMSVKAYLDSTKGFQLVAGYTW
ncbi:hypothetical protein GCM10023187_04960 [Nibrella viscosa]|uniref:Lipid A 3-O-deacylase (PagL) n=1 Tax=Nibrella viscosa TaxID=1084524 RepID=A0ABP8JW32_9BACT